jgi:hypothetical protein
MRMRRPSDGSSMISRVGGIEVDAVHRAVEVDGAGLGALGGARDLVDVVVPGQAQHLRLAHVADLEIGMQRLGQGHRRIAGVAADQRHASVARR